MEARKALEMIEQLERGLAELYGVLHERFKDTGELARFFYQLQTEEVNHANMAAMQLRIVRGKPKAFGEVDFNFSDFKQVLDAMAIVRAIPADKVKETLVQCYIIETSLVEQYVVSMLKNTNEDMRQLLEMLSQGFRDHLGSLAARVKAMGADLSKLDTARRHPRVALTARTVINDKIYAQSVDISEGGMFLLSAGVFSEGEPVSLSFPLSNKTVTARGRVRYAVPKAGIAVVFTELSDDDQQLITAYVEKAIAAFLPAGS